MARQAIQTPEAEERQAVRKHIFAVDGAPDFLGLVQALFEFEQ